MSHLRLPAPGARPSRLSKRGCALVLLLAVGCAGCSTTSYPRYGHAGVGAETADGTTPVPRIASRSDLEEDGMEAQIPPPPSIRLAPDDPSEPYSPNYGIKPGSPPPAPPSTPVNRPSQPQKPPAPARSRFAGTLL